MDQCDKHPIKTILITGATSGIGLAAAEEMAARGWHVIGIGRTAEKCRMAGDQIRLYYPDASLVYLTCDLSSQREVNGLAVEIQKYLGDISGGRLDVLVSNAGTVRSRYSETEDRYETQFAVNHLAGFLLTQRMLSALQKSPIGRILVVSSNSHRFGRIHWRDVMLRKHYSILAAYSQSKLANVLFAAEFNRRFANSAVRAYSVDPGLVHTSIGLKGTGALVGWFWQRRSRGGQSPYQAACTISYICKMPAGWHSEYVYFMNCEPCAPARQALNAEDGRRLWDLSARLCGLVAAEDAPSADQSG